MAYSALLGTIGIDVHTKKPRLGYRITASLQRNGEWIPFKSKIVQMDDIDLIRQEYINHALLPVPKRSEFVDIPTSVSPFIAGKWSDTSYSKMRAGQMEENAKEINKLYKVQRDKYTAASPLLDNNGKAMPVITAGIRLTSGWRNPERNERYSCAINSKHQLANALDMTPPVAIKNKTDPITKLNKREPAAFYWILWKAKLSGDVTGQLEDKNSKPLTDFKDRNKNGIPDAYEKAKHLHIQ